MTGRAEGTATAARPPGRKRAGVTDDELDALERCTGVRYAARDAQVLLDPRGQRFQRLEWVGDSLLDAVVACWLTTSSEHPPQDHARWTSDRALADAVATTGLLDLLDWTPSPVRQADLGVACVGAAWWSSPAAAVTCAGRLLRVDLSVVLGGGTTGPVSTTNGCLDLRAPAAVGSFVLEAAAALQAHGSPARGDWDEGDLSRERAHHLSGRHLVRRHPAPPACGPRSHVVDHLQAEVGEVAAERGLIAGLEAATALLGPLPAVEGRA